MNPSPGARALAGVGVLVTRPKHQAAALCERIEQLGGVAFAFPVLEIADPADSAHLRSTVEALESFDWAIFVSANAVERAARAILAQRSWPQSVRIATVGKRSAEALSHFRLAADLCPEERFTSEALLDLPQMQEVRGLRFVIFRGNGGREYLADTLRARGAQVEYVEAYRRVRPQAEPGPLLGHWRRGDISLVLVNSAESLDNLVAMLGETGRALLLATPLLVVNERMVPVAEQLGFRSPPIVAADATDDAVLEALLAWRSRSHLGPGRG